MVSGTSPRQTLSPEAAKRMSMRFGRMRAGFAAQLSVFNFMFVRYLCMNLLINS
jgi:hypothetical protein